jgi:PAS domain S-box-containing protein
MGVYRSSTETLPSEGSGAELRAVNESLVFSILRERESLESAERERAQLKALLGALHDGVVIADGEGRIVMANEGARRIMGIASGVDIDWDNLLSLDMRWPTMAPIPREELPLSRAMHGGRLADAEMLLVRPGGEVRRLMASCTNTQEEGKVALAIMVFRDITERRNLEDRLARSERLAAIGTLAAGVAHEINNPLAYVLSNVELGLEEIRAMRGAAPSQSMVELEAMLMDAQLGAERVGKIVAALKTFSRSREAPRAPIDVRPLLELAVNMAFNRIRHRARVLTNYGEVPLVEADDAQLGQVFINLLVNAAQAFPESVESNEIRIVTFTDASGSAVIEIQDTGRGIPAECLPHIFEPFFTTKAVGDGTGLGLSICRNIVMGMGGEITASSQPGTATTFRVVLPPLVRKRELLAAPAVAAPIQKGTVLVVDDEPAIGVALRRILKDHDVTVVTSATSALELFTAGKTFDVILSDLTMPGKSGIDLYNELARKAPKQAARIVFISGGAFTSAATAFLERVPNELVDKPFNAEAVRSLVQTFIQSRE